MTCYPRKWKPCWSSCERNPSNIQTETPSRNFRTGSAQADGILVRWRKDPPRNQLTVDQIAPVSCAPQLILTSSELELNGPRGGGRRPSFLPSGFDSRP